MSMDRDGKACEIWEGWEREYGEGRESEGGESEPQTTDGSLYIPTPECPRMVVRPILLPNRLCMIEMSQLGNFVSMVNQIRSCTTPGCKVNLAPVAFNCHRLGGAITVRYSCDVCNLKGATFEAHSKCKTVLAGSNTISVSLQVAFIIAGSTHVTYCKTLIISAEDGLYTMLAIRLSVSLDKNLYRLSYTWITPLSQPTVDATHQWLFLTCTI